MDVHELDRPRLESLVVEGLASVSQLEYELAQTREEASEAAELREFQNEIAFLVLGDEDGDEAQESLILRAIERLKANAGSAVATSVSQ